MNVAMTFLESIYFELRLAKFLLLIKQLRLCKRESIKWTWVYDHYYNPPFDRIGFRRRLPFARLPFESS
jgi:hypothetical protein